MGTTVKQKQSLYFPDDMLREIMAEAVRLDRSLSWTVQQAWHVARPELRRFPAAEHRATEPGRSRASGGDDGPARPARPSGQVLEFLTGKFDHDPS
jgi:uncharacterized small protein (TIGR04563 family)